MAQNSSNLSIFLDEYNDLVVSVFYIIFISLGAHFLRIVIRRVFSGKSWLRILASEIVATGEMCATCFELGNVADNYGITAYAIFYFASSLWWALTWGDAYASPSSHLEDYLNEDTDSATAMVASVTELVTACLIYKVFVKPLWSFGMIPIHTERLSSVCSADLSVRPLYGGLVEGMGTLLFSVISKVLATKLSSELLCTVLNSILDTALVVMAYDISGGYFNPVLATSMQFGCEGASSFDHVGVYWAGGIWGTIGGLLVYKRIDGQLIEKQE